MLPSSCLADVTGITTWLCYEGKNEREMMGNRMKGIDANRIKDQGR